MKNVYIFLADGFEPLEAVAPMDILRRGGIEARFVSVTEERLVKSTQGFSIPAHLTWTEFTAEADTNGNEGCMIFPGGLPGSDRLGAHKELMKLMKEHYRKGGLTCAICAAPARVLAANLGEELSGRKMTVYKGMEGELQSRGLTYTGARVEQDGNLICGEGPGLAIEFGLAVLRALAGEDIYLKVKAGMLL